MTRDLDGYARGVLGARGGPEAAQLTYTYLAKKLRALDSEQANKERIKEKMQRANRDYFCRLPPDKRQAVDTAVGRVLDNADILATFKAVGRKEFEVATASH